MEATLTSRTVLGRASTPYDTNGARARDWSPCPRPSRCGPPRSNDEFLKLVCIYGREWKKVAEQHHDRARRPRSRSHAQKYFKKIEAAGEGATKAEEPAAAPWCDEVGRKSPRPARRRPRRARRHAAGLRRRSATRYDDDQTPSDAASDASDAPPVEKPAARRRGLVIPQDQLSRANSDDRAPACAPASCDDLRVVEAGPSSRDAHRAARRQPCPDPRR